MQCTVYIDRLLDRDWHIPLEQWYVVASKSHGRKQEAPRCGSGVHVWVHFETSHSDVNRSVAPTTTFLI